MKTLEYTFDTVIEFSGPVREHAFVLRLLPRRGEGATVLREKLEIVPDMRYSRQQDSFGNELAVGGARALHDHIEYRSSGIVRMDLAAAEAVAMGVADRAHTAAGMAPGPAAPAGVSIHPLYRYPSPLVSFDEDILAWAQRAGFGADAFTGWNTRVGDAEGVADVAFEAFEALGHAVHELMEYEPGSTTVNTTAAQAFAARRGVCQDFAHIMISVLRSAGVPARYVSGLAVGEGVTHAWAQAYIGGCWRGYDPTRDNRVNDAYLPIAVGRDWSDCPIERGSFWGLVDQTQTVFMTMHEVDG